MGSQQFEMFDKNGIPYVKNSDTSKAAAKSMRRSSGAIREKVFRYIAQAGLSGATDDEIEAQLELRHQTASARRRELVLAGRIVDSGRRRPTRSGRKATVWVVED